MLTFDVVKISDKYNDDSAKHVGSESSPKDEASPGSDDCWVTQGIQRNRRDPGHQTHQVVAIPGPSSVVSPVFCFFLLCT